MAVHRPLVSSGTVSSRSARGGSRPAPSALLLSTLFASLVAPVASGSHLTAQDTRVALTSAQARAVAAVEAEGAAHPAPARAPAWPRRFSSRSHELDAELRERLGPPPEIVGGPERTCVTVPPVGPEEQKVIRSGEMVIGGALPQLEHGRPIKLWWKPLVDASLEMKLAVRGWRLDAPEDTATFRIGLTAPRDSDSLEFITDEAAFPGGVTFPSPGTWIVVGYGSELGVLPLFGVVGAAHVPEVVTRLEGHPATSLSADASPRSTDPNGARRTTPPE